jgi:hypothetical protein
MDLDDEVGTIAASEDVLEWKYTGTSNKGPSVTKLMGVRRNNNYGWVSVTFVTARLLGGQYSRLIIIQHLDPAVTHIIFMSPNHIICPTSALLFSQYAPSFAGRTAIFGLRWMVVQHRPSGRIRGISFRK